MFRGGGITPGSGPEEPETEKTEKNLPDTCYAGKIVVYPYEDMSPPHSPGGTGGGNMGRKKSSCV